MKKQQTVGKYKKCNMCKKTKPYSEFYHNASTKDGYQYQCILCHRKQQSVIPMSENTSCPSYLGVFIGEQLCRHLFKDVKVMPYANPGYDFVCNKGMKIDVKTACLHQPKNRNPHWNFRINYNKIPDYFILCAFDNRKSLEPQFLWMIPGHEINNIHNVKMVYSTLHKWDKWKHEINDVQLCCTTLKSNHS